MQRHSGSSMPDPGATAESRGSCHPSTPTGHRTISCACPPIEPRCSLRCHSCNTRSSRYPTRILNKPGQNALRHRVVNAVPTTHCIQRITVTGPGLPHDRNPQADSQFEHSCFWREPPLVQTLPPQPVQPLSTVSLGSSAYAVILVVVPFSVYSPVRSPLSDPR